MSMRDPLEFLREYIMENKEIPENNGNFIFGKNEWPKSFETNCSITQKGVKEVQFYKLESLIYFAQNKHLPHLTYVQQAGIANIAPIRRPDRKKILNYFSGSADLSSLTMTSGKKHRTEIPKKTHGGIGAIAKNHGKKQTKP